MFLPTLAFSGDSPSEDLFQTLHVCLWLAYSTGLPEYVRIAARLGVYHCLSSS